jgi:hypothetical protein
MIASVWLTACAHPRAATTRRQAGSPISSPILGLRDEKPARALEARFATLDSTVDRAEARRLAECAFSSSRQLAQEYEMVWPAFFHNMLVNAGWKKRGLCHHWADDLYARFRALELRTLKPHLAIARPGTRREHNCVVIVGAGQPLEQGIVLDAWRHSGRLYFTDVKEDHYPWQVVRRRDEEIENPAKPPSANENEVTSPDSSSPLRGTASRP